jgi:SP family general alpha glucoside:H+ symporter-like MFS transporter
MGEPTTSPAEKPEVARLEETPAAVNDNDVTVDGYDDYGLVKSRFDELSILETVWVFKRVVLVSLAVYTGYVCEGFEVSAGITISQAYD